VAAEQCHGAHGDHSLMCVGGVCLCLCLCECVRVRVGGVWFLCVNAAALPDCLYTKRRNSNRT
jgi:hypothetical protein